MPLLNYNIPTLVGGVTQQPSNLGYVSQAKELENAWPSMVDGLQKRYPSEQHGHLAGASFATTDKPKFHFIDKSTEERYVVAINGGAAQVGATYPARLSVFDLLNVTGTAIAEPSVRMSSSGYAYLDSTDPNDYRFQTIGDVTYVLNRKKIPAMLSDQGPGANKQAIMYVRSTLASTAQESVVVTFNGASTGLIHDGDANTSTLAYNILAAITGADTSEGSVTIDPHESHLVQTSHNLTVGDAIRFTATTFPSASQLLYVSYIDNSGYTSVTRYRYEYVSTALNADSVLYVTSVTANNFKVSFHPGGSPLLFTKGATGNGITVWALGTGSPPTGFEKCVVQHAPKITTVSDHSVGNVFMISHQDGEDFTLEVRDGAGNTLVDIYKDSSQTFGELPDTAVDGFVLQIRNDPGTALDDYYVSFRADTGHLGQLSSGYWVEVAAPSGFNSIDPRTMPHILLRIPPATLGGVATFAFMPAGAAFCDITAIDDTNNRLTLACAPNAAPTAANTALLTDGSLLTLSDLNAVASITGLLEGADAAYYVKAISTSPGFQVIELWGDWDGTTFTEQATFSHVTDVAKYGVARAVAEYSDFQWDARTAGSSITVPDPTFIGKTIEDISFFKNRLALASGENFILTEMGEFFNFFRTTATQLIDTAPIDVASSWAGAANVTRLVPYGDGLLGIAPSVQFLLKAAGSQNFGATTVSIDIVSTLAAAPTDGTAPALMGTSVYLPFTRGDYVGLYEYTPDGAASFTHEDITDHVPQYIPGPLRGFAALEKESVLVCLGHKDTADSYKNTNELYVYKSHTVGEDRVQSAWSRYDFYGADIRDIHFYDNDLYIILSRTIGGVDSWWVDKISFKTGRVDSGSQYVTHLDRRAAYTPVAGEFSAVTGNTTLGSVGTLYSCALDSPMEVVTTTGERLPVLTAGRVDNQLEVKGNHEGVPMWVGEKYNFRYKFLTQYLRERSGNRGVVAIVAGRTQLRTLTLLYADTFFFRATVSPIHRASDTGDNGPYVYEYTGKELGGGRLKIGQIDLSEAGRFKFPIYEVNENVEIEISNDTPYPSNLVGAEVETMYHSRAGRMS